MADKKKYTAQEIMATENAAAAEAMQKATDYGALAQSAMDAYNSKKFTYDANEDPLYRAAAEAYRRQGELGAKNVQAKAAQYTGGYGNSYGAMAAQQQYNEAVGRIAELMPQFEQNAYEQYKDQQAGTLQTANYYNNLADNAYAKARDAAADARYAENSAYERGMTADQLAAEEEQRAYERQRAELATQWNIALQRAAYGDYKALEALGVDTKSKKMQDNLERAAEWAKYGDYSLLKALGINTSALETASTGTASTGTASTGTASTGTASKGTASAGTGKTATKKATSSPEEELTAKEIDALYADAYRNYGLTPQGSRSINGKKAVVCRDASGNIYYLTYNPNTKKIEEV